MNKIMKRCGHCKEEKSEFEFYTNRSKSDGLCSWCKECMKEYSREYNKKNKQIVQNYKLEYHYSMLPGQYEKILKSQNGVCAICHKIDPTGIRLAVDHCKKTNKNRGLLCANCNLGIGQFKHDVKLLKQAINYLEKYNH